VSATAARYRVTAFAISLAALAYVQRVAISQAAEGIQVDLGLGKAELGLVFGAFGLSYALFEIPNGLLGDRLGVRVTLTRIVIAWSVFTALTGAAWNFTSLWIGPLPVRCRRGGVFSQSDTNAQHLAAAAIAPARAGPDVGMHPVGRSRHTFVGPGTRAVAGMAVGVCCVGSVGFRLGGAFYLWFRDDPAEHPAVNAEELSLLQDARALTTQEGESQWYRSLLKLPVMILVFQYFCFSFVWYFYVTWLPSYLRSAARVGDGGGRFRDAAAVVWWVRVSRGRIRGRPLLTAQNSILRLPVFRTAAVCRHPHQQYIPGDGRDGTRKLLQ